MITEKEHKFIYSIVDKFGGEEKLTLRNKILSLLNRHDAELKKRVQRVIDEI
jgi:hypothetical protein